MLDLAGGTTVYLACGATDLRKSYHGLAAIVKLKFQLDPYSRCMFAFCNRRRTSIKIWFRRLALSANMRKQRIDTVRLKLLKIVAKVVRSARYITFKLCSSCPYKNEFYETLSDISKLQIQLE